MFLDYGYSHKRQICAEKAFEGVTTLVRERTKTVRERDEEQRHSEEEIQVQVCVRQVLAELRFAAKQTALIFFVCNYIYIYRGC